jgi:hypothetical protein
MPWSHGVNQDSDIRHRGLVGFSTESRLRSHVLDLGYQSVWPTLTKGNKPTPWVNGADISAILPKYRQTQIHEPKKKSIS